MNGLGPLQHLLDDPDVSEIMVVDGEDVYIEDALGVRKCGTLTPHQLSMCLEHISRVSGRRLDLLSPVLDAPLPDGSRACVVIPPIAMRGPSVTIRKFSRRILPLAAFGSEEVTDVVKQLITSRANVVVSGATSSGKTSLLSAATKWFQTAERVVCVEDTHELRCALPHVVHMQTRPANAEGVGEVSLQQLVRASLRMRPDRLIVGEVRGPEVIDMLLALSSGHTGCWSTAHATNALDTAHRLATMVVRGGSQWSMEQALLMVTSSVDAVIHVARTDTRRRRITQIVGVTDGKFHSLYGEPVDA